MSAFAGQCCGRNASGRWFGLAAALLVFSGATQQAPADELSVEAAREAMGRAVKFFDEQVSADGAYLWRYSSDLSLREGEGRAGATTGWVQPPGTPTVGDALLEAYQLTGDKAPLQAAMQAGRALARTQLQSGGWDYRIEMAEADRAKYRYRVGNAVRGRNTTTLDDNTTQAALQFLMRLDYELKFADKQIHETVAYAQQKLLEAQYPNGAWPQRFDAAPDPAEFPVRPATLPETWSRTHPAKNYKSYYTFNDNTLADMIKTMLLAEQLYEAPRFRRAAVKAGEFILLAQLPEPQPGWAQQYDAAMQPAWARKFEPPAVTGGESQGVMRTLLDLYQATGEQRFVEPLPRALDYYKRSQRSDGRLARFYELRTNKPLYFTKDYRLTYSDDDMPTHYGFVVGNSLASIERRLKSLRQDRGDSPQPYRRPTPPRRTSSVANRAAACVDALDRRGAWVERGRLRTHDQDGIDVIETRTFAANLRALAQFIGAK